MRIDDDLRRQALGSLLLGFVGEEPPRWLLDALAHGLGGVVLFGSNVGDGRSVDRLTARLRDAAGRDIVVALDEEGGDVTRLDTVRGSASPGACALGFLDDEAATEAAYAAIAARLVDAGVTLDLAPVADVNLDPDNPVIGLRSFGADPVLAARHVAAAVRGLQSAGVAACAKHFPGHGATSADSHHEVATVTRTRDELERGEFVPFRAAVDAGVRAVMTGHLLVAALDPDRLATVSRAVTHDVLRGDLGFDGTVVTDALEMRALADTHGLVGGFVAALAAGADAIETGALAYPHLVEAVPAAVAQAVERGGLRVERVEDAARRTAMLARRGGAITRPTAVDASRCLEVLGALPVLDRPLVLEARPPGGMASGELPWSLGEPLSARTTGVTTLPVTDASLPAIDPSRSLVVVVRDPHRHAWQHALLRAALAHPAAVVVDVGWPAGLPGGPTVVRTRGVAPGLLDAAADLLAGRLAQVSR
ncbi:MAG: glycoside hydrolase family 3 N-terminal domain-containing protein [Jatrophihabitans sp.]|uniref:glycoside hydrolase family 3 N-terminal domain-containing protein n=1 Tax=Jatrophihabitans sp. TaxID=1932789 RepID=UPI003F7EB3DC